DGGSNNGGADKPEPQETEPGCQRAARAIAGRSLARRPYGLMPPEGVVAGPEVAREAARHALNAPNQRAVSGANGAIRHLRTSNTGGGDDRVKGTVIARSCRRG